MEPERRADIPPNDPPKRTAVATDDADERRALLARFARALDAARRLGRSPDTRT